MRRWLLVPLLFIATGVNAWTPPDYATIQLQQQARDNARETRQRERLKQARANLAVVRNRVSQDDALSRQLQAELNELQQSHRQRLATLVSERDAVTDLYTTARQTAGDLITILRNSPTAPPTPDLEQTLTELAVSSRPLDLKALGGLWESLHLTLSDTAQQKRDELSVQTAPGVLSQQLVTRIGTVLAVADDRRVIYDRVANLYRTQPSGSQVHERLVSALSNTESGVVDAPFAPGRLTAPKKNHLVASVRQSGPIGLLIVALGGIGLVVLIVRAALIYRLLRAEQDTVRGSAAKRLRSQRDSHPGETSESLAGWLNTALRREIRRVQWGHGVLSVIIGIAPLLGLLGTVTGMILTFHALRLFGTGDPVLMADGIGQALTTTMLGLSVAIPLLIGQRWLLAKSNRYIRQLDALVLSMTATARSVA